ncbi:MAG: hypothetical protein IPO83_08600 [Chitinophagaceae bacterium]|nr:hypothetical protein [Chitinophagaceae bacterium]
MDDRIKRHRMLCRNGKIFPYHYSDSLKKIFPEDGLITGFFCDEEDNLVFSIAQLGILTMDAKGNASIKNNSKNGLNLSFLQTKSNIVLAYSVFSFNKGINGIINGKETEIPYTLTRIKIPAYHAAVLPSASIVMSTATELLFIDLNHLPLAVYPCSVPPLFIYPESDSSVWISQNNIGGIFRLYWNRVKGTVDRTNQYYTNVIVSSICTDSANGFWFTTLANGCITSLPLVPNCYRGQMGCYPLKILQDGADNGRYAFISTENEIFLYRSDSVFLPPKQLQFQSEKPIQDILISGNLLYVIISGGNVLIDLQKDFT